MTDESQAMHAKKEILSCTAGISGFEPRDIGIGMLLAALEIFAKSYPAKLSSLERGLIKENYPDATRELINERAMSNEGTMLCISALICAAQIPMDYSPHSNVKADVDFDMDLPQGLIEQSQLVVADVYQQLVELGLSPFGTATLMISLGSSMAKLDGVNGLQLLRPLLETADTSLTENLAGLHQR